MADALVTIPEEQADEAYAVHQRILVAVGHIRRAWIDLARELHTLHAGRLWEGLGLESFEAYIAQPEIGIKRRWIYQLIQLWQEVVLDAGAKPDQLEGVEVSKLIVALPAVRRKQVHVDRVLADAQTLTRDNMRQAYGDLVAPHSKPLDAEQEPDIVRCPVCGTRVERDQIGAAE